MTEKNWLQAFTKSDKDRWLGGICGGLGESTPLPSWVWRLMFVLIFAITYGMGFFIYILLWIFVPTKSKIEDQ
jgi:phage shock protein PspC (stress-responsive transcriptional regulator)